MSAQRIGILHPGDMGNYIAAAAKQNGHDVCWASEGRSVATQERAVKVGLRDVYTLANLCGECSIILCVCPPHAAESVARSVLAHGFTGLYVDANAIAPQRAVIISDAMTQGGARFVDGGIIGLPGWESGKTWLYLSGPLAPDVAACFEGSPLKTPVLDSTIGSASALKMCYAAYTKGVTALLCGIVATAESMGVREALLQHWGGDDPAFPIQVTRRVREVTAKAWRFAGEMEEIATTFRSAGLPGGIHEAAATLFSRLAAFKDATSPPALDAVLGALIEKEAKHEK